MPELDVCYFYGNNGHRMYNCMKKKAHAKKGIQVKQIWILKDLVTPVTNPKGPKLVWVPKNKV